MSEPYSLRDESPSVQLYCGNCGAPIPPGKHFCEKCLAPASLAVPQPPAPLETKLAADQPEPMPDAAGAVPAELAAVMEEGLAPQPQPEPAAAVTPEPEPVSKPIPVAPSEPQPVSPVVPVVPSVPPREARVVPPVPSRQAAGRWPWLVLLVGGVVLGLPLLFFGCIFLFFGSRVGSDGSIAAAQYRLVSVLCCIVPGAVGTGLAILGGIQYFRQER